jgi:hypothetical protein
MLCGLFRYLGWDFMEMASREYFERRERAERAAAKNAASPQARRIHEELAQNYAELAQQLPGSRMRASR